MIEKHNIPKALLISLMASLAFPLIIIFMLAPSIDRVMISENTDNAFRTAEYIAKSSGISDRALEGIVESTIFKKNINDLIQQFNLYKVKVFSQNGTVLFSTTPAEIGLTSDNRIFKDIVARGERYSKYEEKGSYSVEGLKLEDHVIEAYLPLVHEGKFSGAVEVYYSVTSYKDDFWRIKIMFSLVLFVVSFATVFLITAFFLKSEQRRGMQEQAEQDLSQEQLKAETIFSALGDSIIIQDRDYKIIYQNRINRDIFGTHTGEYCYKVYEGQDSVCGFCPLEEAYRDGKIHRCVRNIVSENGTQYFELTATPLRDAKGGIIAGVKLVRDITELKQSELERENLREQLFHSQKMEAVGLLAGGLAHDFNNMLSAIIGYAQLAQLDMEQDSPLNEMLHPIIEAGEKAAGLTQQLLAFSRKQVLKMEPVDINEVVTSIAKMLRRLIREDITLDMRLSSKSLIMADRVQLEQVLLNLVVNAKDAMPNGGHLGIETADVELSATSAKASIGLLPGRHVRLVVSDTGEGIPTEVLEKIFEPFFTTKELGKGTGLGLATVYGVVMQHRGSISVESAPDRGTIFTIHLPVTSLDRESTKEKETVSLQKGTGTVLVVDDDETVGKLMGDILARLGYNIMIATSGYEAAGIITSHAGGIDLMLTDVIMPGMNGKQLAEVFVRKYPDSKIIFMSGYADDVLNVRGVRESGVVLLDKPIYTHKLAAAVREALEGKPIS